MNIPVMFPHHYLSNQVLLRHQLLFTEKLLRVHTSDRAPRDSKEVKQFINAFSFPEDHIPPSGEASVTRRFNAAMEQAYEKNNPVYMDHMQKFGVERTSTKTFHFCHANDWHEVVEKLTKLGFCAPDLSKSWCMATPMICQIMVNCGVIEKQKETNAPRCTDAVEYDDQVVLLETLPAVDGGNKGVTRAVLSFPYVVPADIETIEHDRMKAIRDELLPVTSPMQDQVMSAAKTIAEAGSEGDIHKILSETSDRIEAINSEVRAKLSAKGVKAQGFNGQYRWYVSSSVVKRDAVNAKKLSLSSFTVSASEENITPLENYPGCFILAQEEKSGGVLGKLFGMFR